MTIDSRTRELLAKLLGMLGTDNDNERANAANFIKRKLDAEGVSFGDLANLVRSGGAPIERVVYRDVFRDPTPATPQTSPDHSVEMALKIMELAESRMSFAERRFVRDIIHMSQMLNSRYPLSTPQADWLRALYRKYCAPAPPPRKPRKPRVAVPQEMLDELGLTDDPPRAKPESKPKPKPRKTDARFTHPFEKEDFDDEIPF